MLKSNWDNFFLKEEIILAEKIYGWNAFLLINEEIKKNWIREPFFQIKHSGNLIYNLNKSIWGKFFINSKGQILKY